MNLSLVFVTLCCFSFLVHCKSSTDESEQKAFAEDQRVVNETITIYGSPEKTDLPGAEVLTDRKKYNLENLFIGDSANYTIRTRQILHDFSFNARYEKGIIKEDRPTVKGLFTEYFEREAGGFYIRTIGYTLDNNGYRQFLIDLSTVIPNMTTRISSVVLASLIGGNSIG